MTESLPDSPRRFVAGARCPSCQQLDKLRIYRLAGIQYRECVACSYQESLPFEPVFRELETRVNRTAAERDAETGVVRLVGIGDDQPKG